MEKFNYNTFYDRVGVENGWDFSKVQCETEGQALDFYGEVRQRTNGSFILLDIGTGGGENAVSLSDEVLLVIGIDHSTGMISTAHQNLIEQRKTNVRFLRMDAARLEFPDRFFDVATCRHSEFSGAEVFRTLRSGGVFMTQQVSENDKVNIKQFFGRGQAYGVEQGTLKEKYIKELQDVGFGDIQIFESNVTEYYSKAEDLLFLLKHTPIIPNFGETEADFRLFNDFVRANSTKRGIITNSSRFMLIASK